MTESLEKKNLNVLVRNYLYYYLNTAPQWHIFIAGLRRVKY